jgi:peptide/nickel transport system substrate-binding protein
MALPYKQALGGVGFNVDLQVMDYATLIKRRGDPAEYDIFSGGHPSFAHPVLQVYLAPTWPGWWASEEKDKIVGNLIAEPDPEKQKALVRQLQATQWRELPCIKVGEGFNFQSRRNELNGYANWTSLDFHHFG